ncbi:MAG: hypothetical protein WC525_07465 [Candidatus Thermoplasmatota archaeon]
MDKKLIAICIITAAIVLLTGFSSALASPKTNLFEIQNNLVTIEVNYLLGRQSRQTCSTVTVSEAEEIRHYLIELHDALERNDGQAISTYKALLKEKGIFLDNYQKVNSNTHGFALLEQTTSPSYINSQAGENISNTFCYFNAIGEGLVAWWLALLVLEGIIHLLKNTSSLIVALILFLTFLPFFVLTMLFTNLIPFRILAPSGVLSLKNGTVSAFGLNGFQRVTVGPEAYGVNLSGFTGITINIPPINNRTSFLFLSGLALKAEGKPT